MKKQLLLTFLLFACFIGCSGDEVVEETVKEEHVVTIVSFTCEGKNLVVEFDQKPHDLQVHVRVGVAQVPTIIPFDRFGKRLIIPNIGVYERPTYVDIVWSSGKEVYYNPCN